jgi:GT2 family glycosyltransferase
LNQRRRGVAHAGYCVLLDEQQTSQLDVESVRRGEFMTMASRAELKKLATMDRKARFYNWTRHPTKPKMFGGNVGIHRQDYEAINGYDENFTGWGCEDDDLRLRLRQAGMRIRSILRWTRTYHLWHPLGATTPHQWRQGANVAYLNRAGRSSRCERGLIDLRERPRAA